MTLIIVYYYSYGTVLYCSVHETIMYNNVVIGQFSIITSTYNSQLCELRIDYLIEDG